MIQFKHVTKKLFSGVLAAALTISALTTPTAAAELPKTAGTYELDAELSCHMDAMGGVEFAEGLFTGAKLAVDSSGSANMTVGFSSGSLTIYSVACNTFVDATTVTPGYYVNGEVKDATYTLSSKTAQNAAKEDVNYVESMTFPVSTAEDTYYLWFYLNSNVMGCQFGDGNGTAGSNQPGVSTKYAAKLTVDWSKLSTGSGSSDSSDKTLVGSSTSDATITYEYKGTTPTYEVSIPAKLDIPFSSTTGSGTYKISLDSIANFADGDYVTVTAPGSGTLTSGSNSASFTNSLTNAKLTTKGQSVSGTIAVKTPPAAGTYTGTLRFTISLYASAAN